MPILPSIQTTKRRRLGKGKEAKASPAPVALTLVAATYESLTHVRLTFDRAVNADGINPGAVTVLDGIAGWSLEGNFPVTLVAPNTVEIELWQTSEAMGDQVIMSASALTGIVAVNDGGTWAGVSDLVLPFP